MDPMALVDKKFSQVRSAVKYIYLGFLCVTRHRLIEDTHREASKRAPTVSASRVRASSSLAAVDRAIVSREGSFRERVKNPVTAYGVGPTQCQPGNRKRLGNCEQRRFSGDVS